MSHVTADHVSALVAGFLSEKRREQLRRHIDRRCADCLDTIGRLPLAVVPSAETLGRLVEATLAPREPLAPSRRDEVWGAIVARRDRPRPEPEPVAEPAAFAPPLAVDPPADRPVTPAEPAPVEEPPLPPEEVEIPPPPVIPAVATAVEPVPPPPEIPPPPVVPPLEPGLSAPAHEYEEPQAIARPLRAAPRVPWAVVVAVVVTAVMIGILALILPAPDDRGVSGAAGGRAAAEPGADRAVELRVLVGRMREGSFRATGTLRPDDSVPRDAVLRFEMGTKETAARYIFAVSDEGGVVRPIYPPAGEKAGRETRGVRPVAWRAEAVTVKAATIGTGKLVAAASPQPAASMDDVVRAWEGGGSGSGGIEFDTWRIEVGP